MKRLVLVIIIASMFTLSINAQTSERKWGVGIFGGAEQYSGDLGNGFYSFDNAFYAFGEISIDRYLTPHFDVSLQASMGDIGYLSNTDRFRKEMLQFNLNLRYNILNEDKKLNPFLFAGIGAMRFTEENLTDIDNWSLPVAGFGLTYKVSPVISIRFQENFMFSNYDLVDGVEGSSNDKYLQHSLGIVFNIGKMKDSDGDGIGDAKDLCPDVPGLKEFNGCPDSDGDGIVDSKDDCPKVKGDAKYNGCPDTDGDGVIDKNDKCPKVKGLASLEGCPDSDGDGIADKDDACPKVKGLSSLKGCPDSDGDGIADKDDDCPNKKGSASLGGCPDRDGDGIADNKDDCPDKAGIASLNGCPQKEIEEALSFSAKNIQFNTGKSIIKTSSFKDIDNIINIMKKHSKVKFSIEGHTDNTGNYNSNKKLSQARANAVRDYIVSKGVSADRLTAVGYGSDKPVDSNKTAAGRQNNRRVEFVINQ